MYLVELFVRRFSFRFLGGIFVALDTAGRTLHGPNSLSFKCSGLTLKDSPARCIENSVLQNRSSRKELEGIIERVRHPQSPH